MREVSYSILRLGLYEFLKEWFGVIDFVYILLWKKVCFGVIVGVIGSVIVCFIDVVKICLMVLLFGNKWEYRYIFYVF